MLKCIGKMLEPPINGGASNMSKLTSNSKKKKKCAKTWEMQFQVKMVKK